MWDRKYSGWNAGSVHAISPTHVKTTYLVESVSWLVTAEVVLKSEVKRMDHHLQWEKNRRLQFQTIRQCITALQFAVEQTLEIALWKQPGSHTVSAGRLGAQHPVSIEPDVYQ